VCAYSDILSIWRWNNGTADNKADMSDMQMCLDEQQGYSEMSEVP
jgi:hypothetical protein